MSSCALIAPFFVLFSYAKAENLLNDAYLRGIMNHFGDKMLADAPADSYLMDYPLNRYATLIVPSLPEEEEE